MPSLTKLTALSYGQQKKAMIAFALATNTGLLVLDEPTNGLDIPSKAQFRKLVAGTLGDDRCVVISTHLFTSSVFAALGTPRGAAPALLLPASHLEKYLGGLALVAAGAGGRVHGSFYAG